MSSEGPNARRRVVGLKRRLSGVAEGTKNYLRGGRAGGEDTTASSAAGEGPEECDVRSAQGGSIRVSDYESLDSSSDAGRPPASSGWLRRRLRQVSNRAASWPQPNMSRRPDAPRSRGESASPRPVPGRPCLGFVESAADTAFLDLEERCVRQERPNPPADFCYRPECLESLGRVRGELAVWRESLG